MPYLNCPHCRLTVYTTGTSPHPEARCPRCDALLSLRPGRLFGAGTVPARVEFAPKTAPVRRPAPR
jgi:hypothetical protein